MKASVKMADCLTEQRHRFLRWLPFWNIAKLESFIFYLLFWQPGIIQLLGVEHLLVLRSQVFLMEHILLVDRVHILLRWRRFPGLATAIFYFSLFYTLCEVITLHVYCLGSGKQIGIKIV